MKNDEPMRNINPFGLRLQPHLRSKLEDAAEANKRSLNAEISARLEESFLADAPVSAELVSAYQARRIAAAARKSIAAQVRKLIVKRINEAIRQGLVEIDIDLTRFTLMQEEREAASDIADSIDRELKIAGYKAEWDDASSLTVRLPSSDFPESLESPSKSRRKQRGSSS